MFSGWMLDPMEAAWASGNINGEVVARGDAMRQLNGEGVGGPQYALAGKRVDCMSH